MFTNAVRRLSLALGYAANVAGDLIAACLLIGDAIAHASDWIPSTDLELGGFADTFVAGITADPSAYGLVAGDASALQVYVTAYDNAFSLSNDPATRTPVTISAKDDAKNALKPQLRRLGNLIQANPAVSNDDKIAIGLTVRDTIPTPVSAPTSFPLISILNATPFNHNIAVNDSDTPTTKAKPAAAIALEWHAKASATPITDPELIEYAGLETVSPFQMTWSAGDVGKTAYYAARWITRTGLVGPWSDIASMTIAA